MVSAVGVELEFRGTMIFGSDFDNTIADYDALFHKIALKAGLVDDSVAVNKTSVRNFVRQSDGGEILWQELQADVYGPRINEAVLFSGVVDFFGQCIERQIPVFVVSHKTQYASRGDVDLRQAALGFMNFNGLFNDGPYGLSQDRVYFANTRQEKGQIIASLGCDVFIDDLIEVFAESTFPATTSKYLFSSQPVEQRAGLASVSSWAEFAGAVFSEMDLEIVRGGNG